MKHFFMIAAGVAGTLGAAVGGLTLLLEGMQSWKIACLIVGALVVVGLVVYVMIRIFNIVSQSRNIPYQRGDYYFPPAPQYYQNTPPQLAQPTKFINVPTLMMNGKTAAWDAQLETPNIILTTMFEGKQLSVPLESLERFANCATPVRREWDGNKTRYGEARNFFIAHGLIHDGHWLTSYPLPARIAWLKRISAVTGDMGQGTRDKGQPEYIPNVILDDEAENNYGE